MMSGGRYFNPLRPLYLFPRGDNFDNVKVWERFVTFVTLAHNIGLTATKARTLRTLLDYQPCRDVQQR